MKLEERIARKIERVAAFNDYDGVSLFDGDNVEKYCDGEQFKEWLLKNSRAIIRMVKKWSSKGSK